MRVLTQNLWVQNGDWNARRALLREGIAALRPDVVGLQEVVKTADVDTAAEVLGDDYAIHHQATGLLGDGNCAAIASRWPLVHVEELDLQLTPRTADFPATTLIATIEAPGGPLIYVNHLPSWKPELEYERERQTLMAARRVEEIVADTNAPVVLAGDLDATPDATSIRFLAGKQSLDGTSVCYLDAFAYAHPGEAGHTFTPDENPLVMEETVTRYEVPRRIDYVFVRYDDRGPCLRVTSCERAFVGVPASDHFGVVADLER